MPPVADYHVRRLLPAWHGQAVGKGYVELGGHSWWGRGTGKENINGIRKPDWDWNNNLDLTEK